MIFKIRSKLYWLLLFYLTYIASLGLSQLLEVGSCSQKCQNVISHDNDTLTEIVTGTDSLASNRCSCRSSCKVYRDCCYDSEFRSAGRSASMRTICLSLSNKARYKAVGECSANWTSSSHFCTESVGHLPPVTSKATGITYVNIHCAICNEDADQLVTWKVELRCCDEHDALEDQSERRFIYQNGYLQSVISRNVNNIRRKCICKFFAHQQDNSFVDSLELRVCEPKQEISKCSLTWGDVAIRDLCDSFLEPVYSGDKVYRNLYCAQCNYERLDLLQCKPAIVERMISEGANYTEIYQHCLENNFHDCMHFFRSIGRGRSYSFSSLLNINERECFPVNGRRCCDGERYDFRSRMCRKVY